MTRNQKIVIGSVSLGLMLLIGITVYFAIRRRQEQASDYNPYGEDYEQPTNTGTKAEPTSHGFTRSEIKTMQEKLLNIGYSHGNFIIINAIIDSGGIDGVIGTGFKTALNEAIKRGYVTKIEDIQK